MTLHTVSRRSAGLLVTVVVALGAAGCTAAPAPLATTAAPSPGITDDSVLLGISAPLSGPLAAAGTCAVAGLTAYLDAGNASGGFRFGDGATRTVELEARDDTGDAAMAQANFRALLDDGMFAYVGGLGTATNTAILPVANELAVPQVLLLSAARTFSARQDEAPWTLGLLPTYLDEGRAFGEDLVARGPARVAVLAQDDAYGDDYVDGLTSAIEGSDVEIVASATVDPGATSVDRQVAELAGSHADVLLSAVSTDSMQLAVLNAARAVEWLPDLLVPSNTATPASVVLPGNGAAFSSVRTVGFAKSPTSPEVAADADVVAYTEAFQAYGASIAAAYTPHCAWSYIEGAILEQAFAAMTEPTRESFLTALHSLTGFKAPLLLDGVVADATDPTLPAIHGAVVLTFDGSGF